MQIAGANVLVTGAGSGIGAELCREFHRRAAGSILVLDLNGSAAERIAEEVGGVAAAVNVADEQALTAAVSDFQQHVGAIDIACSNAGVGFGNGETGLASADNDKWRTCWEVNVMAHVFLARALLPDMLARRSGHFVQIASAAGLLLQVDDAAYSASKSAAISFAESLAVTHGEDGIGVTLVCPQYVTTSLLDKLPAGVVDSVGHVIPPEAVAKATSDGIEQERFLVLPHPEVGGYLQGKAQDYDRWINAMQGLRRKANR